MGWAGTRPDNEGWSEEGAVLDKITTGQGTRESAAAAAATLSRTFPGLSLSLSLFTPVSLSLSVDSYQKLAERAVLERASRRVAALTD